MRRLLPTVLLFALLIPLAACEHSVSPEGYVSETPVEAYMRNLPKAYGGQRHLVLKPPSMMNQSSSSSPAVQSSQQYSGMDQSVAPATDYYTSEPMPAPVMVQPLQATPPVMTPPGNTWASDDLSPNMGGNSMVPQQPMISQPSSIMTREVDYGHEITIYPLDHADAPMPYIPPAPTYEPPPVQLKKPVKTTAPRTAGMNK